MEEKLDQIIFLLKEIHKCAALGTVTNKDSLNQYMGNVHQKLGELGPTSYSGTALVPQQ